MIRKLGTASEYYIPKDTLTLIGLKEGDEIELEPKTKEINLTLKK